MKKLPEYSLGIADPSEHTLSAYHWEAYVAIRDQSFSELLRTTAARRAYFIHVVAELEKLNLVSADEPPITFAEYASGNSVSAKVVRPKPKPKKEEKAKASTKVEEKAKVEEVAAVKEEPAIQVERKKKKVEIEIDAPKKEAKPVTSDVLIDVKGKRKDGAKKAVTLDF